MVTNPKHASQQSQQTLLRTPTESLLSGIEALCQGRVSAVCTCEQEEGSLKKKYSPGPSVCQKTLYHLAITSTLETGGNY